MKDIYLKLDVARGMDCGRIAVSTDAESSSSSAQVLKYRQVIKLGRLHTSL